MRQFIALPALVLGFAACTVQSASEPEALSSRNDELVGGHVAAESEYPSTVSIGNCTAAKVGPRHFLTAAHCVSESLTQLSVTTDNNAQNFRSLTVTSVKRHPQYTGCTTCAGDGSMNDFGLKPDAALITVDQLTPDIPQAVIDSTPVAYGAAITLTGYGCENGVGQPSGPSRLKVGDTQAIDPLLLDGAASIPGGYVASYGPANTPAAPGLCPGDSGGPLFRTGTNKIIGINALVSFVGEQATPYGNWFTRLDTSSRYNVYNWVTSIINASSATPCTGLCTGPTTFTNQYFSSGNLGTTAKCFETSTALVSGNCGGFVSPRKLTINGTTMACTGQNWTLPAKRNGGYCFQATAGNNSWAYFSTF